MTTLLHHTIEQSAQKYPDHIAYRFDEQSLTYAELNRRTNSLAHLLHELDVKRGDRIGIHLHQSMEIAIAIYGILKAGAVFVPLDPSLPVNRIAFVIKDCGIEHVITQNRKLAGLTDVAKKIEQLKSVIGVTAAEPTELFQTISWEEVYQRPSDHAPAVPGLIEQDLAYIMYTSGSTGTPKGLMHTHHSGLRYAKASVALYDVTPDDVISGHAPIHFDISTFAMFASPLAGATAVIIPEEYKMLPASLSELMQDEKMTIWYSVTTAIVELIVRGALDSRNLSSLRWIKFGGEPFPPKHMQALQEMLPNARVCNVYGPAEVNQCTYFHVPALPHKYQDNYVPIGYVWNAADGLVVDENDEEVPAGKTGELLIAALTRMQGYWKQPELTERGFYRQRPYPDTPYEKIFYRTGDLVRLDEDGLLHFLGRKDRQMKIRGYRVELDEIEAALTAHKAVAEAAVYPMRDPNNNQIIEAAVVLKQGAEVPAAELIKHGAATLPAYAVPQSILLYETFPRTGSGKINRRALQQLSQERQPAR